MNPIFNSKRPVGKASIVRDWVERVPVRMQGVLLTAIRGCDTIQREAGIKTLARMYRSLVIHGLNDNPKTFLLIVDYDEPGHIIRISELMQQVLRDHDALPHHYLMHLIHAAQIVGDYHPHPMAKSIWGQFYANFCRKMHMLPETSEQLAERLCEPSEESFAAAQ